MKKISAFVLAALLLAACSNEDDITPRSPEECYFENTYGSSLADLKLQSDFFDKNKIYVVFNDTLRKEIAGYDENQNPYYDVRLVDIGYGMNVSMNPNIETIDFEYLSSEDDKVQGVRFLEKMILPSLGDPLRPFSFLLVNKITHTTLQYGMMMPDYPVIYSGWRCSAIALPGIGSLSDDEKELMRRSILQSIVVKAIGTLDQTMFEKFYSYCEPYYETYALYDEAEAFIALHPTMYDLGFLSSWGYGDENGFFMYNFKGKSDDLSDYTSILFSMTETEFRTMYADYPIVLKKYDILKSIVEGLGVVF